MVFDGIESVSQLGYGENIRYIVLGCGMNKYSRIYISAIFLYTKCSLHSTTSQRTDLCALSGKVKIACGKTATQTSKTLTQS